MTITGLNSRETAAIARVLDNRFGGGLVYIAEPADRTAFARAVGLGFIDTHGFITDAGLRFWQHVRDLGVHDANLGVQPFRLRCEDVWGGTAACDQELHSRGLNASLYASAARGAPGGGDIYYLSVCEEDALTRVLIADVVGHGAPVSRVSRFIYDALQAHRDDPDSGALLGSINRLAASRGLAAMTTAAALAYYTEDRRLSYAYAGHAPALIKRAGDSQWSPTEIDPPEADTDTARNVPLAIFENAEFEQRSMPLAPGDRVFLYTDGVVDTPSPSEGRFGIERLKSVLDRHAELELGAFKRAVVDALRAHSGGTLPHDDVTLIALEVC